MTVRVAVAQIDPRLGDVGANVLLIEECIERAAADGAQLAVFPECAATGYVYRSWEEAWGVAQQIPGPISDAVAAAAIRHGIRVVVGTLERAGNSLFNTAVLCGPGGLEAIYRKTHTLCLGVDRFTTPGDIPFAVHDLGFLRLGILICYDLRFPEPARALALAGVQAIALPTNWPHTSTLQPDVFTRSRAAENRMFVLAADRCGTERGTQFLGRSQIVDPNGDVLTEAPERDLALLIQDIDPGEADRKNVVLQAGEHEMDCMADRRPELYGDLAV